MLIERLQLLSGIYEVNAGNWEPLLEEIGRYLEGSFVALVVHDFTHNRGSVYSAIGCNRKYLDAYAHEYAHRNVWLSQESNYRPAATVHIGEHIVPEHRLVNTAFYTRWLQPQDLHHRLCAVLSREESICVFLEVMRPLARGRFDEDLVERCRLLVPHLQRVLQMHHRMADVEVERDVAFHVLDQLPWGVLVVDSRGNRLIANQRAQEILLAGDGLTMHGGTLRAALPDETARLDRLLRSALNGAAGRPSGPGGALSITRRIKGRPLNVLVVPLRIAATEGVGDQLRAAAIYLSDPDARLDRNEQYLRELYALTAVEARLAASLAQGKSVEEAATAMGVAVNTARTYLKRIYNKTGVRRQAELVRLLLLSFTPLDQN